MPKQKTLSLETLSDGAALELFQAALSKVLDNIQDPNTDWKPSRQIRLDVVFKANEDRNVGAVTLSCTSKLAGLRGVHTIVYIGKQQGSLIAVEQPRQDEMFPSPGAKILGMPEKDGDK